MYCHMDILYPPDLSSSISKRIKSIHSKDQKRNTDGSQDQPYDVFFPTQQVNHGNRKHGPCLPVDERLDAELQNDKEQKPDKTGQEPPDDRHGRKGNRVGGRVTPVAPGKICDRLKAFMNSSSETHPFSWTMTLFINARIAGPP
jgi:hypothetical protein